MTQEEAKKTFLSYAKTIKKMGFRVYVSKRVNPFNDFYGWIVNDKDEIGIFEYRPYEGIHLGTMHKPARNRGTGFGVGNPYGQANLSKELIEQVFLKCPGWAKKCSGIIKWTATEYFQNYWDKDNVEEI